MDNLTIFLISLIIIGLLVVSWSLWEMFKIFYGCRFTPAYLKLEESIKEMKELNKKYG